MILTALKMKVRSTSFLQLMQSKQLKIMMIIMLIIMIFFFSTISLSSSSSLSSDVNGVERMINEDVIFQSNDILLDEPTDHGIDTLHNHNDNDLGYDIMNAKEVDTTIMHRMTQTCVGVYNYEDLRSAIENAPPSDSTVTTIINICEQNILMNQYIYIIEKSIQFNCVILPLLSGTLCTLDAQGNEGHFNILNANVKFNRIRFMNSNVYTSIYIDENSSVELNYVTMDNNIGDNDAGAIYINKASLYITNSIFSNNEARNLGGAIVSVESNMSIVNSTLSHNKAGYDGGALYLLNHNQVTVTNTTFTSNTAGKKGGAIFSTDGNHLDFTNVIFSSNTVGEYGTVLYTTFTNYITMTDIDAYNNSPKNSCEIYRFEPNINEDLPSHIEIDGMPLSAGVECYYFPIPSSSPSSSSIPSSRPSLSPSKAPSLQPSTVSSTFKWVLVNANGNVDIGPIKMDQMFRVNTTGTNQVSVRLDTPYTRGRVVFRWRNRDGSIGTRTRTTIPFLLNVPYLSTSGIKTINATMTSATGELIGTSTIRFNMMITPKI